MNKRNSFSEQALKRAQRALKMFGTDALLLFDRADIFYFSGTYFDGAVLILTKIGRPVLIIDSMNFSLAADLLKDKEILILKVRGSKIPLIKETLDKRKVKKAGFNADSVSVSLYDMLGNALPEIRFYGGKTAKPISSIMREIRELKNDREIELISKAARKTVKLWRDLEREIKPGMTEIQIAGRIDSAIHLAGYKNSFTTIAATGKNTAFPHAIPTCRKLRNNDHLLVDFGLIYKGYCSDLTRTLYKGRIDRQIGLFRDLVLEAQQIAIRMISPGVKIRKVIETVDEFFIKNNVTEYALHGLGHGVGLEVHEAPFFRKDVKVTFKKGMVLTVEPGLYMAGIGGVRHEDMILVTEKGCEVLTK